LLEKTLCHPREGRDPLFKYDVQVMDSRLQGELQSKREHPGVRGN